jgi:hypothetical protein
LAAGFPPTKHAKGRKKEYAMIEETIKRIETTLQGAKAMAPKKREELMALLAELKGEVTGLSETNREGAESIAGFTQVTAHEATRADGDRQLLNLSLKGLSGSVNKFEASHPKLVKVVNDICTALSGLGL